MSRTSALATPVVFRVVFMVVFVAGVTTGCSRPATREDCHEILEHYIDLSLEADPELQKLPPPQARAVRDMKRAVKLGEESYRKVELRCESEVSSKQVRCAKGASSADEWQACID